MRVLALDLSTRTGWALFEGPDRTPRCGTLKLDKPLIESDYAARTLPLRFWLKIMVEDHAIDVVGFESPFIPIHDLVRFKQTPMFRTTQHTLRLQIALATEIETTAAELGKRCLEVGNATAKKALVGRGRRVSKENMLEAALARDWPVADDHQADACGVAIAVYDVLGTPVPLALIA